MGDPNNEVGRAIKLGILVRGSCEVCGDPKTDGHHDDYTKPLQVRWLCRKHHAAAHVELRRNDVFLGESGIVRVRLSASLHRKVQKQAGKEERTMSSLVRFAILEYLETQCESAQS